MSRRTAGLRRLADLVLRGKRTPSPAQLPDPTEDEFLDFLSLVARGVSPEDAAVIAQASRKGARS